MQDRIYTESETRINDGGLEVRTELVYTNCGDGDIRLGVSERTESFVVEFIRDYRHAAGTIRKGSKAVLWRTEYPISEKWDTPAEGSVSLNGHRIGATWSLTFRSDEEAQQYVRALRVNGKIKKAKGDKDAERSGERYAQMMAY